MKQRQEIILYAWYKPIWRLNIVALPNATKRTTVGYNMTAAGKKQLQLEQSHIKYIFYITARMQYKSKP